MIGRSATALGRVARASVLVVAVPAAGLGQDGPPDSAWSFRPVLVAFAPITRAEGDPRRSTGSPAASLEAAYPRVIQAADAWMSQDADARLMQPARVRPDPWWAPAASALLPGTGQAMLGQDRAIAYLAAEAYGWLRFAADNREATRQRAAYRRLAANVARAYFSDPKPNGNFEYYERMENFVESGVFDASIDDGTQPETDSETFNGSLWLRARSTFWEDPAVTPPSDSDQYISAVRYYEERAIRPAFRWSWRDAQLEQDLFRRTIERSNDAYRRSLQDLGIILANHVLSTVDAYVTLRIRQLGRSRQVGVAGSLPWSPDLGFGDGDRGRPH